MTSKTGENTARSKTCFVIMPIGAEGTPANAHFRSLYDQVIKPTLELAGFDVTRADEVQRTGAITRDIVLRLADADLVVADLTDLNPNVFYELGVRHSLRGQGTVMIVDELRTNEIPFDLSAYRVIQFRGELQGIGKLRQELLRFVTTTPTDAPRRDNPVHDWMPALPVNALDATRTPEGELRLRLATAERRLRDFEETYGPRDVSGEGEPSPLSTVMTALAEANEGTLPSDLLQRAQSSGERRDKKDFLSALRLIMERQLRLEPDAYGRLGAWADTLGLDDVVSAVFAQGRKLHPKDESLRWAELETFAHSQDSAKRERARREFLSELGVTVEVGGGVQMPRELRRPQAFGVMMDAFFRDGLTDQALAITEAGIRAFPDMSVMLRNHFRSLDRLGRKEEALQWLQRAVNSGHATETEMAWLGTALHNRERYVDALEAYLAAALIDPNESAVFAEVADEISWILRKKAVGTPDGSNRPYPDLDTHGLQTAIDATLSCPLSTQSDVERVAQAAKRADLETVFGGSDTAIRTRMSLTDRIAFIRDLYEQVRSGLTEQGSLAQGSTAVPAGSAPAAH